MAIDRQAPPTDRPPLLLAEHLKGVDTSAVFCSVQDMSLPADGTCTAGGTGSGSRDMALSVNPLSVGFDSSVFDDLMQPVEQVWSLRFRCEDLHLATEIGLQCTNGCVGAALVKVHLHTNGSDLGHDRQQVNWCAVAAIGELERSDSDYIGAISAPVVKDGPHWMGVRCPHSAFAEASRMLHAVQIAAASHCRHAVIHYDAEMVGRAMQEAGQWYAEPEIFNAGRGIARLIQSYLYVECAHVKAHVWHSCDKLPDTSAKHAAKSDAIGSAGVAIHHDCFMNPAVHQCACIVCPDPERRSLLGSPRHYVGHCGILLVNNSCKICRKVVRNKTAPLAEQTFHHCQSGGLSGTSTDLAAHVLRSFLEFAKIEVHLVGILFVDVISTFYSVLRQFIFIMGSIDEDIAELFAKFDLPPEAILELFATIDGGPIFDHIDVFPHLKALFTELHLNAWFCTEGVNYAAETDTGTKPGDPFGDLVSNFLLAKIQDVIHQRLQNDGIGSMVQTNVCRTLSSRGSLCFAEGGDVASVNVFAVLIMPASSHQVLAAVATDATGCV